MKQAVTIKVVTAMQIDEITKKKIESFSISKHANKTDTIKIEYELDSSIIGGVLIKDGEKCYDGSIKSQLIKLRKQLMS